MATTIGVVGGGQLAAMLVDVCTAHGSICHVLDPDPHCPAVSAGARWVDGDSWNADALAALAGLCDVITVEIEHVCVENLAAVEAAGTPVKPGTRTLARLVNKLSQKQALQAAGIATSAFLPVEAGQVIDINALGLPVVWKASRGGYDGRGVEIIRTAADAGEKSADGYIEAFVEAEMELAVMVAVSDDESVATWAPVEMEFDRDTNILEHLISPARTTGDVAAKASQLAIDAIRAIGSSGVFGVEMFLTVNGELLVNEIASRTHNSGHVTMDAAKTSQFEQQYRILTGQPLGPTASTSPAVMSNILGRSGYRGKTVVENLAEVEKIPDTHVHLYGKRECFPQRKMGHVTLTGNSIDEAIERMNQVQSQLVVRGEQADG